MRYDEEMTEREIASSWLTGDEVAAVRKPLEQASVMPLKIYSSKAYFEREADTVLRPGWHALAHVDQLAEPGAYVTATILNEPVMVLRDKDGTIRALSNVCRHRGAQLLTDCGVAKALICPYHTWTYNLDGSLRGAPHMNKIDGFDRKSIHLPEFRVELWNGFVFVNLDADAPPLAPQIEGLTALLAPFGLGDWEVTPWRSKRANWNWKASLENFSEAYHHVGIHQNSIGKISKAENALYEDSNDNYSVFFVHTEMPDGEFISDQTDYPFTAPETVPERFVIYSPVVNVYPTFHLVMSANFVLWLRIDVHDVNDHTLIWHWLVPPGSKALPDFNERIAFLVGLLEPVIAEDLGFLPQVGAAARSQVYAPGRYSDQERAVHQMHRWLIRMMEARGALSAEEPARP